MGTDVGDRNRNSRRNSSNTQIIKTTITTTTTNITADVWVIGLPQNCWDRNWSVWLSRKLDVERKDDTNWLKRCMTTEVDGTRQMDHPRKTWWDYVREDMNSLGLSRQDAQSLNKWSGTLNPTIPYHLTQVELENGR